MMSSKPKNEKKAVFSDVSAGRRRNMQANKGKNTKPELIVRRLMHRLGYRFRVHNKHLPGKPDIVLASRKKIIEIRGCFWHGHGCFPIGQLPKTRQSYWTPKIAGNKSRDAKNIEALLSSGWSILELWECQIRKMSQELQAAIVRFLGPTRARVDKSEARPGSFVQYHGD